MSSTSNIGKYYMSADCRLLHYPPSVIAAATMIYAIRELETRDALEYENQLMSVLRTSKV